MKDIISISGMPGLYKLEASRDNGIIVLQLGGKQRKFISDRQHMFTPLENITIFTDGESIGLKDVFIRMGQQIEELPLPESKVTDDAVREWFTKLVPEHDAERVYTSDIRKMIKWWHLLEKEDVLPSPEEEESKSDKERDPSDEEE